MPITVNHSTPADGTFSATGATAWDANHTLTGVGTLAEQNANAVAITGGTINGTTVGSTTPSTVNATTITGQTGVISGGNNNFLYSNTFTNAYWLKDGSLSITAGQTDPFGGTTATLLSFTNQFQGLRSSSVAITAGGIYTASIWCYVASGTRTFSIVDNGGNIYGTFTANTTWNRYSVTFTSLASTLLMCIQDRNASGFVNAYVYGAQVEQGSTASIYVPTTTAAVNTSNTLNIAGSQIFTATNGSLSLQPAGTGALQAQATTSTTAGGNARGANAVDWQTLRSAAATRVASGAVATVSGGTNNSATAFGSVTCGGDSNQSTNTYSFIGAGAANTASAHYSSVVSGYSNSATGRYNFIGNGYANSGTANAAVTTQSATMNGTTAVTLSGSNASIKVGQLITGTSITNFPDTYVSAISGTSLTLSQAASGSSTSTLSFFTPHGVVVGGGNNQATGSYSFIGGGGDAGTAANRNTASGAWSTVVGGWGNVASGGGAFIGGGGLNSSAVPTTGNTASGNGTVICGGMGNTATASYAIALGGFTNVSNGLHSVVLGGSSATARGITGNVVFSGSSNPFSFSSGAHQAALLVLGVQTTDATPTALCSNSSAAGTTNQVILPNNSAYFFTGEVISGVTGGGNTKGWTIEGVIKRGANAASTALVGTPTVTSMYADVGAATWAIAVTADTTNGGIRVTFTGQAATTIRTVCRINTVEMTF
jgi:hypothetical protein